MSTSSDRNFDNLFSFVVESSVTAKMTTHYPRDPETFLDLSCYTDSTNIRREPTESLRSLTGLKVRYALLVTLSPKDFERLTRTLAKDFTKMFSGIGDCIRALREGLKIPDDEHMTRSIEQLLTITNDLIDYHPQGFINSIYESLECENSRRAQKHEKLIPQAGVLVPIVKQFFEAMEASEKLLRDEKKCQCVKCSTRFALTTNFMKMSFLNMFPDNDELQQMLSDIRDGSWISKIKAVSDASDSKTHDC